jgi:hypothetical protein
VQTAAACPSAHGFVSDQKYFLPTVAMNSARCSCQAMRGVRMLSTKVKGKGKQRLRVPKPVPANQKPLLEAVQLLKVRYTPTPCYFQQHLQASRPDNEPWAAFEVEIHTKPNASQNLNALRGRIFPPFEVYTNKKKDRIVVFAEGEHAEAARAAGAYLVGSQDLVQQVGHPPAPELCAQPDAAAGRHARTDQGPRAPIDDVDRQPARTRPGSERPLSVCKTRNGDNGPGEGHHGGERRAGLEGGVGRCRPILYVGFTVFVLFSRSSFRHRPRMSLTILSTASDILQMHLPAESLAENVRLLVNEVSDLAAGSAGQSATAIAANEFVSGPNPEVKKRGASSSCPGISRLTSLYSGDQDDHPQLHAGAVLPHPRRTVVPLCNCTGLRAECILKSPTQ